jgi:hypothetical protein
MEATSCPALAVLSNRTLVAHIARFQRGLPWTFQRLRRAYEESLRISLPSVPETLWCAVMSLAELRLVQQLYRTSRLPELAGVAPWHIEDVASRAAVSGRLDVLVWLDGVERDTPWASGVLSAAMRHNHHDIARWLLLHRPEACIENMHTCLTNAASSGKLDVLQDLLAFAPHALTSDVMDAAACCGHLEMLRFLHAHPAATCSTKAMDKAAEHGLVDVVAFLHAHRSEGCTTRAMDAAAAAGSLAVVRFLHANRTEGCTQSAMDNAASLEVVRFLHEHRTEGCTPLAMDNFAAKGDLATLRYLHAHRSEGCTPRAVERAAQRGHVDVVRFLHENCGDQVERATDALTIAAVHGHVEIVQFLFEKRGFALRCGAMLEVLRNGHLATTQYLHDTMGVPLGEPYQIEQAVASGNDKLVEYVVNCTFEQQLSTNPSDNGEPSPTTRDV